MRKTLAATVTCLAILITTNISQGQLLVGYDEFNGTGADQAWNVDPTTGSATALWGGVVDVWGMAYGDDKVFVVSGTEVWAAALGETPSLLGNITDVTGANISVVGLTWANGGLYASRNITNEAIYSIDLNTFVATVALDYVDADYDFGGLGFNSADGLMYGTNDDTTPNGSGLYSIDIFGSGAITLVTPYPAGETDIDGLAIGEGIAYLVEDEAGDTIHPYDLAAGAYLPSITSPMQTSEVFSGAAYVPIPEPSSLVLLMLAGFGILSIRKSR